MEINDEINTRVKAKIKHDKELGEYIDNSHIARICPECGKALKVEEKYSGFFGFISYYKCSSCSYKADD